MERQGLHHNYMRDYDPEVGQYLAQDPYGLITGANRYAYVYGNPVELFDPTGEIVQVFIDQINKTGRQIGGLFEDAWSDPYGRAALIVAGTALAVAALLIAGVAVATVAKIFAIVGAALTLYDVLNCLFCSHTESGMESCNDLAVDGLLYLAGGGIGYGVGKAVKGFRTARKVDDVGDVVKHADDLPGLTKPDDILKLPSPREHYLNNVTHSKLRNHIDELFKEGAIVGNGGTADALRKELSTGIKVGGKLHYSKAKERVKGLLKLIRSGKLNDKEREIALELAIDLKNALDRN